MPCEHCARYREALLDAQVMLENIKRNREMPPFAQTLNQYVALGKSIRKLLEETPTCMTTTS